MSLIDAVESLARAVSDRDVITATSDPRKLAKPGVLFAIQQVRTDRPGCRAAADVTVTAIHPGPEALAAAAWLWDVAVPELAAVCGALTFDPTLWDGMPAARATLTLEVTPWP